VGGRGGVAGSDQLAPLVEGELPGRLGRVPGGPLGQDRRRGAAAGPGGDHLLGPAEQPVPDRPEAVGVLPLADVLGGQHQLAGGPVRPDPTDDPIQFKWATEWKDSGTLRDLDDEAILSSSYEPFDPPAPIHRPIDVITATMIRDNFDHATQIQAFRGKVNTSEFVLDGETCPAKSLLCYDVVADMVEKKGAWYRQFTYTFKRDLEGSDPWQYYPLDLGFYEWDDTNDRFTPISQSNGQPIAHPVLLDGAGNRLNMADTPQPAPVNLAFRIREDVNFATIFAA
jgi:hypothetical protein